MTQDVVTPAISIEQVRQIVAERLDPMQKALDDLQARQNALEGHLGAQTSETKKLIKASESRMRGEMVGMLDQAVKAMESAKQDVTEATRAMAEAVSRTVNELRNEVSTMVGKVEGWQSAQQEVRHDVNALQSTVGQQQNVLVALQANQTALHADIWGSTEKPAGESLKAIVSESRDCLKQIILPKLQGVEVRVAVLEAEAKARKERLQRWAQALVGGIRGNLLKIAIFTGMGAAGVAWMGDEFRWWDLF